MRPRLAVEGHKPPLDTANAARWGCMTQPEPRSLVLRIHLGPRREKAVLFPLDLLLPRNREGPTQKLLGCLDLLFKLSNYMSPLTTSFG